MKIYLNLERNKNIERPQLVWYCQHIHTVFALDIMSLFRYNSFQFKRFQVLTLI